MRYATYTYLIIINFPLQNSNIESPGLVKKKSEKSSRSFVKVIFS